MESRKRACETQDQSAVTKKQALTSPTGSPIPNGIDFDFLQPNEPNLELFRKDAIFRRMKHYSRECERQEARIRDLEQRKSTCEAGLAAMAACWTQLLETTRLFAHPKELSTLPDNDADILDMTSYISDDTLTELRAAMERSMRSTISIISHFVKLGPQLGLQADPYAQYVRIQTECISLRSQLNVTTAKLRELQGHEQSLQMALAAAEDRVDKLRSRDVLNIPVPQVNEMPIKSEDTVEEPIRPPSPSPPPNGHLHSVVSEVSEHWQTLALERDNKIRQMREDNVRLQETISELRLEVSVPSKDSVLKSPWYKILSDHVTQLDQAAAESRDELTKLRAEVSALVSKRAELGDSNARDASKELQDLKIILQKRDVEVTRLREQRDQHLAELVERKQKESSKIQTAEQWKALAESRLERIAALQAEVKRYKCRLAAESGDESLLKFFLGDSSESVSYIDDLQNKLALAEARADALEKAYSLFDEKHTDALMHMKAEAEARQQLAAVSVQLERYQTVYGDPSNLPLDIQKLEVHLRLKTDEIAKLNTLVTQQRQAEASLYTEMERLSSAWEALDEQVRSKVFNLTDLEERMQKANLDRAKLENKYYSALKDKDALDGERKAASKVSEMQAQAVQRLVEAEKCLSARALDLEKEVATSKQILETYKTRIHQLESELVEWKGRVEYEKNRVEQMRNNFSKRERAHEMAKANLGTAQEELSIARQAEEKLSTKVKLMSESTASEREAELQSHIDGLYAVIKCSTCRMRMRDTVMLKCLHTFCRVCIDTRVSTRQRKCPACSIQFSANDAQPLFFQ